MADISKIKTLDGTIYDLKDSVIRDKAKTKLKRPLRFLQISDTHYNIERDSQYYHITHEERMNRMIDWIVEEHNKSPLDFVVLTGDITYENLYTEGTDADFLKKFYKEYVPQIPCPFYSLPGNHDGHTSAESLAAVGVPRQYTVEFGDIVLVMLDTFTLPVNNSSGGDYVGGDAAYLQSVLDLDAEHQKKYIIFGHYFNYSNDTQDFKNLIENDDRILYLVRGHTHTYNVSSYGNKTLVTGGNIAFWMNNGVKDKTFDAGHAWGYVIHELTEDGIAVQHIQPAGIYYQDNSSTTPIIFPGATSAVSIVSTAVAYEKTYDFSLDKDRVNNNYFRGMRSFETNNTLGASRSLMFNTDLNTVTDIGVYTSQSATVTETLTNVPSLFTSAGFRLSVEFTQDLANIGGDHYLRQTIIPNNTTYYSAFRRGLYQDSTITWSDWKYVKGREDEPIPISEGGTNATNADDARSNLDLGYLKANFSSGISSGSSKTITIPNSTRGLMIGLSVTQNQHFMYTVATNSGGLIRLGEILKPAATVTITTGTNTMTIQNTGTYTVFVYWLSLSGGDVTD